MVEQSQKGGGGVGHPFDVTPMFVPPYFFFAPTRLISLISSGGRPDFSAISRSCSWMNARAGSPPPHPPKKLGRTPPVGALRTVFIADVEKGEFALGIGSGFFRHARLFPESDAAVKTNWRLNGPRIRHSLRLCGALCTETRAKILPRG